MNNQHWIPLSERSPSGTCQRVLVTRKTPDGQTYVDVVVLVNEPESGMPPFPSRLHVTHWMPLPQPAGVT